MLSALTMTDEQLVQAYLAGEEGALEALWGRYLKPIYNFVARYIGSTGDAEDITQDIFLNTWRNLRKFDPQRKFKAWIFTIAKNTALNWIKKKKPALFSEFEDAEGQSGLLDTLADPAPLPDELFARADLAVRLTAAIARLRPNYRAVLLLRYRAQLTLEEIAETLGEPVNTIKSRHHRGLKLLREQLENGAVRKH
ncbi:MAG: RNA polymerase sigma factor [Candidatus Liptonbacteria bacterium]|nr:RNA polymerase sigma factor [Candidatus Liptonbacteria bacterium]